MPVGRAGDPLSKLRRMLALRRGSDNHISTIEPRGSVKKQGKVLRDATIGRGLLMVEGQQFPFSVPGVWRSGQPPAPGMTVEVEFGSGGEMVAIRSRSEIEIVKAERRATQILGRLLHSRR